MDGRSEETERAGAAGDPAAQREQRLQRLINRLPSRLRSTACGCANLRDAGCGHVSACY
jgi:hypothetical protein